MPITCADFVHRIEQEDYHQVDKRVLGVTYDVHNQFGRLVDEEPFKQEIAERCRALGMRIDREFRILVAHETFAKEYFVDMLVDRSVVIEAKKREELIRADDAQSLNYLYLTDTQHGSLINLGGYRVQRRFVSTSLTSRQRRRFDVVDQDWLVHAPQFKELRDRMIALVEDWGAFLEVSLYRNALVHFLGGPEKVIQRLSIHSGSKVVGWQNVHLLAEDLAFTVSMIKTGQAELREHQMRLLRHTNLSGLAWINLNNDKIEFTTLGKHR